MKTDIQMVSAPSILGLKPSGVDQLGERLLKNHLAERLQVTRPLLHVPTLNALYSTTRDAETQCINAVNARTFSISLAEALLNVMEHSSFPLVLGGDCSILIGIMLALRRRGNFGLVFMDAHADFYLPEQSPTGELADVDLAIVSGRGPDMLSNIDYLKPYVKDKHIVHIGQRDQAETEAYHALDIRTTEMYCVGAAPLNSQDRGKTLDKLLKHLQNLHEVEGCWLHFDTDVLSDDVNPAVDYRLPGGLSIEETKLVLRGLINTGRISGMSVSIYNPRLDPTGSAGLAITDLLVYALT